ncbi:unnamed protein product [Aureobasidium mustum]|uniref:Uncharacterized protein n=1 Tax=Aureobasidium mustum TaxID=2773714 RepID=A0A9N8JS01_9PEZI|nr:unnamed protein product [Aureobasidium mustum]
MYTLLPPPEMHPIEPANLDWHMEVYTPLDTYEIHLQPGYTIAEHFTTIGKDLSPHIKRRWDDPEDFEDVSFTIYLPDQADLDLIRRDSGVGLVAQFAEYQAVNDPMVESEPPKAITHDEL